MKKGLAGVLMLVSVVAFARGGNGDGRFNGLQSRQFVGQNQTSQMNNNQRRINLIEENLTDAQKVKLEKVMKLRYENREDGRKSNLEIKEKNIQIQKEMLEENVNWSTVKKIQSEIEALKTDQKIIRLKSRKEIEEILGEDLFLLRRNQGRQNLDRRGNRDNRNNKGNKQRR